ncbi:MULTISPECIES: PfaB family protein [Nostocales]|uniref:Beta-ketoacyl synthase n=3 Tax=Nostocales TaxID=1161 RepID=A0A0C1RD18_9CYAN|nr:PfaB family protein [Tolypothrix bouteillei]KAF3886061.1 PfaB family protein [Tolypothrix bouteillei VB521301]
MEKIAIVGFSCLFPGAKNPEEFWQNLIQQKDSTSFVTEGELGVDPQVFYDPAKGQTDKFYSLQGAFIRNFEFDSTGYKLPAEFLQSLDNTFKWSLDTAKQALQHSGYLGNEAVLAKCGVILGSLSLPTQFSNKVFAPIYQQVLSPAIKELLQCEGFDFTSSASTKVPAHNAMISGLPAAIVSQALALSNLHLCIDAACSSPLYAAKLASHYLWTRKADLMLAGGISCSDPLFIRMLFSGIQGYPEDNDLSRPLDKSSRGLITADGVGMVVLKRYSDAVRDGDRIYATISGTGLSNDGRGKHLLSPNSKGQILAFERAYQEAQISPKDIDYMECHATGTLLGDTTEFNSVETFFGKYQATPLVGSVKGNVGHLLVAAGSVSLIKALLSMSKGVIPPTINISDPIGTENNVIAPQRIVTKVTDWPNKTSVKRSAISAFGFGGTNAHMILEQGGNSSSSPLSILSPSSPVPPTPPAKVAIVGMDAFFGSCDGLDAFDRSIYDGTQNFIPLPSKRWHGIEDRPDLLQQYGLPEGKAPVGAYIQDLEIDTLSYKIPPNELAKLNPQQLLLLKVADRALKDAGLKEGGNVAVLIAAETEFSVHQLQQRWNLSWQIKEGLAASGISLPEDKLAQLEDITKDAVHHPVEIGEYLSYISNIMASRISSLWDFTGPTFTITAGENSTFKVLEIAQMLLSAGEVDAVLVGAVDLAGGLENVLLRSQLAPVNTGTNTLSYDQKANGWIVGEGAGAVVLKRHDTAKKDNNRIYAVVDAITPDAGTVSQACQDAFQMAGVKPTEVEYLEVNGSGISQEDEAEIKGLIQAYPAGENNLSCAIGSVKANIGHTYVASGMASLIKTALCLYHKYIPATPKWSGVKNQEVWQGSPFYVSVESRPWFLGKEAKKRVAAINNLGMDGTCAHVILSDEPEQQQHTSRYLQQMPYYLFPIGARDRADLLEQVKVLQTTIDNSSSLAAVARQSYVEFQKRSEANYTLAILGRNKNELAREIESAFKGVNKAFESGEDWQTPAGSYFTAKPLGKKGGIAYVYPAAVNSYVGIGRTLFRLFPRVYDDEVIKSLFSLFAEVSQLVFPRSLNKLSTKQLESLEKQLLSNALAIFETDMAFARLITTIVRDDFQVKPKYVFGYSLGETSMMSAMGVWSNFSEGINAFHSSPLFADRIAGSKNAVREHWGLPKTPLSDDDFWSTYLLMASPSQVQECLKSENRVYLTQINTPEEVLIAGDSEGCQRVIKALGCNAFRAPFNHAIHCEPMRSEYQEVVRVNTLPSRNIPGIAFYSSAEYEPVQLESHAIARSLAKGLCQPLDFPRLVNRVYEDGARIFIEAGSGNVCSRWIDKTLENKEHITIPLNRRGIDDHASIIRALGKLLSHQVSVDLSPLYGEISETSSKRKPTVKTLALGRATSIEEVSQEKVPQGNQITASILTDENRKLFQNAARKVPPRIDTKQHQNKPQSTESESRNSAKATIPNQTPTSNIHNIVTPSIPQAEKSNMKNAPNNSFELKEQVQSGEQKITQEIVSPRTLSTSTNNQPFSYITTHLYPNKSQYEKLSANNLIAHQTHSTFLEARHQFSKQMSEIIQLQLACVENLLNG